MVKFQPREFGWEWERYDTLQDRANYLWTAIVYDNLVDEYKQQLEDTLKKYGIESKFSPIYLNKTKWDGTPEEDPSRWYWSFESDGSIYSTGGYIDHGGELIIFLKSLFNDETLLMNYLFSDDSFIATGNDNDDHEVDDEFNGYQKLAEFYKGN